MKNSQRLLKILMILMEHSNSNNRLQQSDIMRKLESSVEGDCSCNEKTLSTAIRDLIETLNPSVYNEENDEKFIIRYGGTFEGETEDKSAWKMGIPKKITDIYYMPRIRNPEVLIIIDGIRGLDSISADEKDALIKKIENVYGVSGNKKNSVCLFSVNSSADTRENINVITDSIEKEKQITFNFNGYDKDCKLIPNKDKNGNDKLYTVNPYFIVNYKGNHYMLCNTVPYNGVSIYRADLMSNIVITKEKRRMINEINEFTQSKDPQKFMQKHLNMMYGDERTVTLKIDTSKHAYTLIHDMFGDSFTFVKHIDETHDEIEVTATEKGIIDLAMTASDKIEVVRPYVFRKKICDKAEMLMKKYDDELAP